MMNTILHGTLAAALRLAALLALLVAPTLHAALPAGISGAWYNPDQSGHGISLQILADGRAVAFWFVFDPDGEPVHLYMEGQVQATRVEADAFLGTGMRFGSFDPAEHELSRWGQVLLEFHDCDHATLRWNANGEAGSGYGEGSMPLTRLTGIATLPCSLPGDASLGLHAGRYESRWHRSSEVVDPGLRAAVDRQGVLWATSERVRSAGAAEAPPSPVFVGRPVQIEEFGTMVALEVLPNAAFAPGHDVGFTAEVLFTVAPRGEAYGDLLESPQPAFVEGASFNRRWFAVDPLLRSFDPAVLAGSSYAFQVVGAAASTEFRVRFHDSGAFCVDAETSCRFQGQVGQAEPGLAMFAIELADQAVPGSLYQGKAWLEPGPSGSNGTLVLVARSGDRGLGVVAERE